MGHIQKLGKKRYRIRIESGIDPASGKRQRITKIVNGTKEQAKIIMQDMISKPSLDYIKGENTKLKDYLNDWIKNYSSNISKVTQRDYRSIIDNHLIPSLGELPLGKIKPAHIIQYQRKKLESGRLGSSRGLSNRTVQSHHRLLSLALNQAVTPYGLIDKNPCIPVKAPSVGKSKANHFNRKEAKLILDSLDDILLYTIFYLALYTGMRRSEITGLKWKDINLSNALIEIRRTANVFNGEFVYSKLKNESSRRQVAISDSLVQVLQEYKNERALFSNKEQAVFITPDGHPLRPDYLTKKFKKICKKLEFPEKRFHDIRHTHATWLLEEGVNPKIVQKRLGHARVETTLNIYSHISLNEQRKAANLFEKTL